MNGRCGRWTAARVGEVWSLSLAGPGRAWVRLHAPTAPVVVDAGRALDCRWDAATGLGWVEVCRGEEAEELIFDCGE